MSDLIRNLEDRFSSEVALLMFDGGIKYMEVFENDV